MSTQNVVIQGMPGAFTEQFFVEFEAGISSRKARFVLAALKKLGGRATILGSNKSEDMNKHQEKSDV